MIESLLAAGMTSLDPELAGALIGHGGPLKVLYITGDYYDINAVWQTNITSDVNVMYQLQNQPSADLMALDPDGAVTQSVTTGGNELANDAAIVDVNPDATYVGGEIYTNSILVQADLVPTDQDDAVNADTNALVTELIAFVDDTPGHDVPDRRQRSPIRCSRTRWRACCISGKGRCFVYCSCRRVFKCGAGMIVQAAPGVGA